MGNGKYANVSSVTGLDLIDDGRGLAHCDWDWDGKPDFWSTNRTGPRIHFLHNRLESSNNFLAIRLKGTKSNRDAIGARVEVITEKDNLPLIKTLQGGSGFLSQSSKWLHFGIEKAQVIKEVKINWPGSVTESFTSLKPNGFYILTEGDPVPSLFTPPVNQAPLTETEIVRKPVPQHSRVVVLNPPPMPQINYLDSDGKTVSLSEHKGKAILINIWTTWCPNCKKEMLQWGNDKQLLDQSNIIVLPLCADEPTGDDSSDLSRIKAAAAAFDYPFKVGRIETTALETLNVLQKSFIGKQTDLPLPSSLLIDEKGRLAVIYKGPVTVRQVIEDVKLLGAESEVILGGATPFNGRWLTPPKGGPPRGIATRLIDNGMRQVASDYLDQIIPLLEKPESEHMAAQGRLYELAQCHVFRGAIAFDDLEPDKAIFHYRKALELTPGNNQARNDLIANLIKTDRKTEALTEAEILIERNPTYEHLLQASRLLRDLKRQTDAIQMYRRTLDKKSSPESNFELANLLNLTGDAAEAIKHYRAALQLQPGWVLPANNLAWILSTSKQDNLRDGKEALQIATHICKVTNNSIPHFLGTLAAANAEMGHFNEAEKALNRAILIAREKQDSALETKFRANMQVIKAGIPIRTP